MSLKGGLSNAEIREIIAKHAEGGELSPEKYNELIQFYSSAPTKSQPVKTVQSKKKANPLLLIGIGILIVFIIFVIKALAHSGRTDSSGGHNDNSNKSGLGGYHYHCGGYPPHLHTNGTCPYKSSSSSSSSSSTTSTSSVAYTTATQSDRYDEGYDDGYDDGYDEGHIDGYDSGYEEGYDDGHDDGYEEGKEKGYEEGYEAKAKEANAEREQDFYALLILGGAITLIVLLAKFVKRNRGSSNK